MNKNLIIISVIIVAITAIFFVNKSINERISDELEYAIDNFFDEIETNMNASGIPMDYQIGGIETSYINSSIKLKNFKFSLSDSNSGDVLKIAFKEFTMESNFAVLEDMSSEISYLMDEVYDGSVADYSEQEIISFLEDWNDLASTLYEDYHHEIVDLKIRLTDIFSVKVDTFEYSVSLKNNFDFQDWASLEQEYGEDRYWSSKERFEETLNMLPDGSFSTNIHNFSLLIYDKYFNELTGKNNIVFDSHNFQYEKIDNLLTIDSKAITNFAGNYELNLGISEEQRGDEEIFINFNASNLPHFFREFFAMSGFFTKVNRRNDEYSFEFDGSLEYLMRFTNTP